MSHDLSDGTGKPNAYCCPLHKTITVDLVKGVTPFAIRCRYPGCNEIAYSVGYRVPSAYAETASHEWYRPDSTELSTLDRETREHVENGGLLLRKKAGAA